MTAEPTSSEHVEQFACPHCHQAVEAELLEGGAARHRGFKCPHCKLFVPESRTEDSPALGNDAR